MDQITRHNNSATAECGVPYIDSWVDGCGHYKRPGQKNEVLEIRVKRFSSPMRRGGLLRGGNGTGAGPRCLEEGFMQVFEW